MTEDRAFEGTFPCPNCHEVLTRGVPACAACGLRLSGPEAGRLWQVDTSLAALQKERAELIEALLAPAPATPEPFRAAPHPALAAPPRRRLSGQQMLLGLGALLLLSGAAAFLALAWATLGVVGQTLVMAGITVAVAGATRWPSARGLTAAAETGAVITAGLLALDLWAARHLGVAGLERVDGWWYAAVATTVAAVLLLLADAAQPRVGRAGAAAYRVLGFRLLAGVAATAAPWCVLAAIEPSGAGLVAAFLVVALVDAGCAAVALFADGPRSAVAPLAGAALAGAAYVVSGLLVGYSVHGATRSHYEAAALLAVVPVVAAVAATRRAEPAVLAVVAAGVVLGVPLLDVGRTVWLALTLVGTLAVLVAGSPTRRAARTAATALVMVLAAPGSYLAVTVITRQHADTLRHAFGQTGANVLPPVSGTDIVLMLVPAVAGVVLAVSGGLRHRAEAWVVALQVAVAVTAATALQNAPALAWTVVGTVLAVLLLVVAFLTVRVERDVWWSDVLDGSSVFFTVGYAVVALAYTAGSPSPARASIVLLPVGVAVLLYAAAPRRLMFAYVGSLLVSAGVDCLLADRDVTTIEAYTLPLAVLLALVGWVQWSRDHDLPTRLVMGPALSVALLPSLLTTVTGDNVVRLVLVTAAGIALVMTGLSRRWQAPVGIGTLTLVVLAVTQGGPLLGYVPPWVTLATAGALVLAVGIRWEATVATGKRAGVWYQSLR